MQQCNNATLQQSELTLNSSNMATNELKTSKVRRLRSASIREDGTFDFRPDGQGASKQEDIKTVRKSRSYRTSGESSRASWLILRWPRTRKTLLMRCTGTFARFPLC